MGIDYIFIAGLVLYFLTVKILATSSLKPIPAALIVVVGYFAISSLVHGIILAAYDAPLWQLVGLVPISTVVMQLGVALFTFTKLYGSDDSYGSWALWSIVGCIGIFFVAPFIATSLFARF